MTDFQYRHLLGELDQLRDHCRDLAIFTQRHASACWDMPPYDKAEIARIIDALTPDEDLQPSEAFGVPV